MRRLRLADCRFVGVQFIRSEWLLENLNGKWKRNSVGARARESSCVYFFAQF